MNKGQRSRLRRNRNARPVAIDTRRHRIYYRATQVERSAPCEKRPPLEVGMCVAILEERNEFTRKVPKATFYAARVTKIGDGDDPLVTFEYENHPYATSLGAGMSHIAPFCIVLREEENMVGKVNIRRVGGYDPKKPRPKKSTKCAKRSSSQYRWV